MGVMVGIGVAVGPDVGAGLSLQALRTTETVITVTNASRRILSSYPLISVVYPSFVLGLPEAEPATACLSISRVFLPPLAFNCR